MEFTMSRFLYLNKCDQMLELKAAQIFLNLPKK